MSGRKSLERRTKTPAGMTQEELASLADSHQMVSVLFPTRGMVNCLVVPDRPRKPKGFYAVFRHGAGKILQVGYIEGYETHPDGPNQAKLCRTGHGYLFNCEQPVVKTHYRKSSQGFEDFPRLDNLLRQAKPQRRQ